MSVGEIIEDAKKKKGPLDRIMKERKTEAEDEYEATKIKRLVEEEKAKIRELKREGLPLERGTAIGFSSRILQLAQVDPEKAKAFLTSLSQEDLNKITYLMAAESDKTGALLNLAKSTGTSVKDLVEIVKMMRPANGGVDLKGIAEIFKAGVEAAKANQPKGPGSVEEGFKYVYGTFVKPFQETLATKDQEIFAEKLKSIEEKIVNPVQWFQQQKAIAGQLGFSEPGKKGEIDLKLEEMRQSHDLDMQKLTWEQQKFMIQQAAERDKWGAIEKMLSPLTAMAAPEIHTQLKNLGKEVSKSLAPGQQTPTGAPPQLASFSCPSCQTELNIPLDKIPPGAEEVPIKCPKCGVVTPAKFQKTKEKIPPAPTEEKPSKPSRLTYKMG